MLFNALIVLTCLSASLVLFHVLVLLKIIPYQNLWGGRLKSDQEMLRFELVSLTMSLLFVLIYLSVAHLLPVSMPQLWLKVSLWIMTAFFILNTLGNLTAKNKLEKFFFAPLTIVMAVLTAYVAIKT
jgi:hypothetical protein